MSPMPPIRREVLVDAGPEQAFEVFTARLGAWWPLASFSVHGDGGTVSFEDGRIVERGPGGQTSHWGTVTRWEPPAALAFTWHPGDPPERATQVTVTFTGQAGQTLVTLRHDGWEVLADPAAARDEYGHGWPAVLDAYLGFLADPGQVTWAVLLHHPGPGAPKDGSLFADPGFAGHVEFLNRMRQRGLLVAAGPLGDEDGAGMTVLRLPGPGRMAEAARLATEDDTSVASGFFTVTVRPWQVVMAPE